MNDFILPNQQLCANVTVIKFEFVWEGKYVTIIWLYWLYRKIKFHITFSKVSIRHETHILKFFFKPMHQRTERFLLASLSLIFTCNLTPCIKLPAYVRTSCWSAKSILMSLRHVFVNFIQTGRYKANANARSQFCHINGNIIANKKTHSIIFKQKIPSIDLILPKLESPFHRFSLF